MDELTKVPCVLQDFVPFGAAALLPLFQFPITQSRAMGIDDHMLPLVARGSENLEIVKNVFLLSKGACIH